MLKRSGLFILLCCLSSASFSQKLAVKVINPGNCYKLFYDDTVIANPSAFAKVGRAQAQGNCAGFRKPKVNYATQTLIFNMVVADCNATFSSEVIKDDTAKVYRCITTVKTSYCREVKLQSEWLVVPKLPAGYKVVFEEKNL
jgi:hypothetical protein